MPRKDYEAKLAYQREHYWRNRDRSLAKRRQHKYGISEEQYSEMVVRQGGVCASCGEPETERSPKGYLRALAVDHDHATGRVRALLCGACNRTLGHSGEDADRLRRVAEYLDKQQGDKRTYEPDPKPAPKKKGKRSK